jgi:hypothetical protein
MTDGDGFSGYLAFLCAHMCAKRVRMRAYRAHAYARMKLISGKTVTIRHLSPRRRDDVWRMNRCKHLIFKSFLCLQALLADAVQGDAF